MNQGVVFGYAIAALLLLLGLGTMAYVFICQRKKMKAEYDETGYYPYGYYYQKGVLYSIPLAIIIAYFLLPFYDSFSRWSSLPYVTAVCLPGIIIGYILEKKHAYQVRPRSKAENHKRNIMNWIAIVLLTAIIVYKVFILKH